jgi:hypothetical protein
MSAIGDAGRQLDVGERIDPRGDRAGRARATRERARERVARAGRVLLVDARDRDRRHAVHQADVEHAAEERVRARAGRSVAPRAPATSPSRAVETPADAAAAAITPPIDGAEPADAAPPVDARVVRPVRPRPHSPAVRHTPAAGNDDLAPMGSFGQVR